MRNGIAAFRAGKAAVPVAAIAVGKDSPPAAVGIIYHDPQKTQGNCAGWTTAAANQGVDQSASGRASPAGGEMVG